MTTTQSYVEHQAVRVGVEGVQEMDAGRPLLNIPRSDIKALELVWGSGAEQPAVALLLAVFLAALALSGPAIVLIALAKGTGFPYKFALTIVFLIPAIWLVDLALRKRLCLHVHTKRGSRKVSFAKGSDRPAVEEFVRTAKAKFGYP